MDYFYYYIKCYFLWQSLDILCASYLPNNFAEMLQSIQSNYVIRWVIHSDLHIAPFYFIVFVDEQGEWHLSVLGFDTSLHESNSLWANGCTCTAMV